MKTISTYWSVIRSLVTTIVAVMGFMFASYAQYTIEELYNHNLTFGTVINNCNGNVVFPITTAAYQQGQVVLKKDGEWIEPTSSLQDGQYEYWDGARQVQVRVKKYKTLQCNNSSSCQSWLVLNIAENTLSQVSVAPKCGPTVPDIADGATSICLNDADDKTLLEDYENPTIPTAKSQGWTVSEGNTPTDISLATIYANIANYNGKTLRYWAYDGTNYGFSNSVTLDVCPAEVSVLAKGATSICLNSAIELATIAVPETVSKAVNQGWTVNNAKNPTLTLADIKNPSNFATYNGKTLKYWAENAAGVITYSNGVTLNVCPATVENIAGGAASLCINDDDARATIVAPTVSGEVSKGWTINGSKNTTLTLDDINNPSNFATYNGKTLKYWAENAAGVITYSNGVTLNVCPATVETIAGGVSSLCLNDDDARATIVAPTVSRAVAQGWTLDGTKNTSLTLEDINSSSNFATYNGSTLQYWAENAAGEVTYSNGVTLDVCMPTVGDIANSGTKKGVTYICLSALALSKPTVTGPYVNEGWEIVETNSTTRFVRVEGDLGSQVFVDAEGIELPVSTFYGKEIRYYAGDAYGNDAYSNTITLMSRPTVTIDLEGTQNTRVWPVCDGELITEFPSVSYSMNGTTLSSAGWYIFNTEKSGGADWERYSSQVVTDGGQYTHIFYNVYPVGGMCSNALKADSKTELTFKSTSTEIKFTPALSASYKCYNNASATVTDVSGNVVDGVTYWTKNNVYIDKTDGNTYDFTFDCEGTLGDITLGAYVKDPVTGCKSSVSQSVNVYSDFKIYVYNGPTGSSSDVTNTENWVLESDGTTHPSNFTSDACRYIINTDEVELLAGQTWNVSGEGTKVVVGDGNWGNLGGRSGTGLDNAFTVNSPNEGYNVPNGYFELMGQCTNAKWITNLSNIAKYDYRNYAKTFTISGELNTEDNVVVDVKAGSSLTINTDAGDYELGTLSQDKVALSAPILSNGVVNGYSWASIVPGSSVTYAGDGCKKIREATYSQLYIDKINASKTNKLVFEENSTIEIKQSLNVRVSTSGTLPTTYNVGSTNRAENYVDPNGCTILYSGSVNQEIANINYYDLRIANASTKTVGSKTIFYVRNSLYVEPSSTLHFTSSNFCACSLFGSGTTAFVNEGNVVCDPGSEIIYESNASTTVAPVYYGILNLKDGPRVFSSEGIIGISGSMEVGSATCTTTGSTVEFDGAGAQTVPAIDYYNLTIKNSGLDGDNNNYVSLGDNVVVSNQLSLVEGILNTDGHTLSVTNTSTGAVGQGYRVSADSASYVIGDIERALPTNMTGDGAESYIFPVGTADNYMPLSMSKITTGTNASVTVGTTTSVASTDCTSPLTSVNSTAYWKVDGTNYTSSSLSVSSSNGLSSCNTLGFEADGASSFENIVGCSVSDNSICASSVVEGTGTVALATRTINAKTYYYNCNKTSSDASNLNSWWTGQYASGSHPSSFVEDDATWIFDCGTTVSNDMVIGGSNTKVYFNIKPGDILTVAANVVLPIVEHKQGVLEIDDDGELTILNSLTMEDVVVTTKDDYSSAAVAKRANRTKLNNSGVFNLHGSALNITNSYVQNNGEMNFYNVDVAMSSSLNQGTDYADLNTTYQHTRFINNGTIRMVNTSLDVSGRQIYVINSSGAVWLVDNTASPSKKVVLGSGNAAGIEFMEDEHDMQFIYFECGSSFVVKHSDLEVLYQGDNTGCTAYLGGEIAVYDGNMLVRRKGQGGGNFTITQCGAVYMIDTDDSGDGIFIVDGTSGWQVNVEGALYAVGILNQSDGSGNKFNVKDGSQIFVGDIGVTSSASHSWDFSLDVKTGGTMNYCGNRTSGSDALGKNEGSLNYAGSFYQNSSPSMQGDVGGTGTEQVLYTDGKECMAAYEDVVKHNQGSIMLPVELTMLYGICKDNVVELHWQTATESNNEMFVILRSFDGVNFDEIATVFGAGTSTETINYMYADDDEDKTGIVYYKLRQVDFDGKTKESKIIAVQTCGKNAQFSIGSEEILVSFKNPEEKNYVVVTSLTGKIVFSKSFQNVAEARIASPRIKGVYIISVIDSRQITSEKFIR